MNILFYTTFEVSPQKGGTERITSTIAEGLQRLYGVKSFSLFSIPIAKGFERTKFVDAKCIPDNASFESFLEEFVRKNNIEIIINQGAFALARPMRNVLNKFTTKHLLTIHHFNPGAEENFFNLHNIIWNIREKDNVIKNAIKLFSFPLLKLIERKKLIKAYHEAYMCSDRIVLLSDNFKKDFQQYANLSETNKLCSVHNALSFKSFFEMKNYANKKKEVLVVSRLDEVQKRISQILLIWKNVQQESDLSDWKLTIVGHGETYEKTYKDYVKKEGLKNIHFEGAQKPEPYYNRASLFMLTSAYEGWGLTLTEAQQYGVVPLAYNSYASLTDIITDGENGYVIPNNDISQYTKRLIELMRNDSLRKNMATNAIESSKRFTVENICGDWMNLFHSL